MSFKLNDTKEGWIKRKNKEIIEEEGEELSLVSELFDVGVS